MKTFKLQQAGTAYIYKWFRLAACFGFYPDRFLHYNLPFPTLGCTSMLTTQKCASRIVAGVLAGRNLSDLLVAQRRAIPDMTPQQRGAIQDISYGTLRELGLFEQILSRLLRAPLKEAELRALLLIALYQLEFSRAAPYSIVDHAVRVAERTGAGRGKGLVNAVLRNFLRQREDLVKAARATDAGRFSIRAGGSPPCAKPIPSTGKPCSQATTAIRQ